MIQLQRIINAISVLQSRLSPLRAAGASPCTSPSAKDWVGSLEMWEAYRFHCPPKRDPIVKALKKVTFKVLEQTLGGS